jgi:hypothetical protein
MTENVESLPTLNNIIDDIIAPPNNLTEGDLDEFRESIYLIIEDFVKKNTIEYMYYDFEQRVYKYTYEIAEMLFKEVIDNDISFCLTELVEETILLFFSLIRKPRSYPGPHLTTPRNKRDVQQQIQKLRDIPQPEQNTPDWFDFRWTRLTASAAWKALDTDAKKNELIYKKCKPIDKSKYMSVNINSATHHGHKFEPVSTLFYENMFKTEIEEFGCIPDENNYEFGASPDGINVKRNNDRYGYLLEIKNPVSRKLTGIPKREYWVQMQFQMYVTGLFTCDFLETVFKEYDNEDAFEKDGEFNKTSDDKPKGVIVCFHDGTKPVYEYSPWNCSKIEFEKWYDKIVEERNNLSWINNTYWYLAEYSCVTVPFNKEWFEEAKPHFKNIWKIIEKERQEGYDHRKPKKRSRKPPIQSPQLVASTPPSITSQIDIEPPKLVLKIKTETINKVKSLNNLT